MRDVTLPPSDLAALARDILGQEGSVRIVARGASMQPAIHDGDTLEIVATAPDLLRVGDIVLYYTPDERAVVHRISAIEVQPEGQRFLLCGDALQRSPERVEARHILGKVIHIQAQRASILRKPVAMLEQQAIATLKRVQGVGIYRALLRRAVRDRITCRLLTQVDRKAVVYFFGTARVLDASSPTSPETRALGAFLGGQLAGALLLVCYSHDADLYAGWWVFNMQVRLRYRGAGIGERLLEYAHAVARECGADGLQLLVRADNWRAIRLYAKHGFTLFSTHGWTMQLDAEASLSGERRVLMVKEVRTSK